jgi:hypothetical protein
MMRLVVIESPYAANPAVHGTVEMHVDYARRCMADSLMRGEAPIASHLLYTQPGILNDAVAVERAIGIKAGLEWGARGDMIAFYLDYGWSPGMRDAEQHWIARGKHCDYRYIGLGQ